MNHDVLISILCAQYMFGWTVVPYLNGSRVCLMIQRSKTDQQFFYRIIISIELYHVLTNLAVVWENKEIISDAHTRRIALLHKHLHHHHHSVLINNQQTNNKKCKKKSNKRKSSNYELFLYYCYIFQAIHVWTLIHKFTVLTALKIFSHAVWIRKIKNEPQQQMTLFPKFDVKICWKMYGNE